MHGGGVHSFGKRLAKRVTLGAILHRNAHLDHFMGGERPVHFRGEFRRHAGVPDAHDWIKGMRAGLQLSALA